MRGISPSYRGSEPYAFVCYSHQDAGHVFPEIAWLQRRGINIWYDEGISPGHEWSEELGQAINRAAYLLFFVTPNSVSSKHCRNEVHFAQKHDVRILAVHLAETDLPAGLELALASSQAIMACQLPKPVAREKLVLALTEGGAAPTRSHASPPLQLRSRRLAIWALSSAAMVLVAAAALFKMDRSGPSVNSRQAVQVVEQKSIAVLPFTDMSENQDQGYLADGMAVEIIDALARVPGLHVPARTSSFYFKDAPAKIQDIARELGVANVLEGSVRLAGSRLRVTTQLISAASGFRVWSETYDRQLNDVFAVQDDIANAVVRALHVQFLGMPMSSPNQQTQNVAAYQLYLKAHSSLYENSQASLDAAEQYLLQAVELDAEYVQARSFLALTVLAKTDNGFLSQQEGLERVRELAQHALALNPDLPEALGALQYVNTVLDNDWKAAESAGRRSLAIDPQNPSALLFDGIFLKTMRRWSESESRFKAALVRDPLNPFAMWNLGSMYHNARQFSDAERAFRNLLALTPDFPWTRGYLAKTLLVQGRAEEALELVQQDAPEDQVQFLPMALHGTGRENEAGAALKSLIDDWGDYFPYYVALNYVYIGETDPALDWLERAYELRDHNLALGLASEPLLDQLRNSSRFQALLRKMHLLDASSSRTNSGSEVQNDHTARQQRLSRG